MGLGELGSSEEELFFPGFHPQSLRAFKHPDRHDKAKDVMERTHGRETRGYSIQVRELATFVPQAGNNQLKEIARPANLPSTTQRIFRSVSRLFSFCQNILNETVFINTAFSPGINLLVKTRSSLSFKCFKNFQTCSSPPLPLPRLVP